MLPNSLALPRPASPSLALPCHARPRPARPCLEYKYEKG